MKRGLGLLLFWGLIVAAVATTALRIVLAQLEHRRAELAAYIGDFLGAKVAIGSIQTRLDGLTPEIRLIDVDLADAATPAQTAFRIREIRLRPGLLAALRTGSITGSLAAVLIEARFTVKRKTDGSFAIAGFKSGEQEPAWLLQGRRLELIDSEIGWLDEQNRRPEVAFTGLDLILRNDAESHRLALSTALPPQYGRRLNLAMTADGNFLRPAAARAIEAYFEVERLNLAQLPPLLPAAAVKKGVGDISARTRWRQGELDRLTGFAKLSELSLARRDRSELRFDRLQGRFDWASKAQDWQLRLSDLTLAASPASSAGAKPLTGAFYLAGAGEAPDLNKMRAGLAVKDGDLRQAAAVLRFFGTGKAEGAWQLKGELQNFTAFIDPDRGIGAVNGAFRGLSFGGFPNAPDVAAVNGRVKGDLRRGSLELELAGGQSSLNYPAWFRDPLAVRRFHGRLYWRQSGKNWALSCPRMELDTPDFTTASRWRLVVGRDLQPLFLDFQSAFDMEDAGKVKSYLPVGLLTKSVGGWLADAFGRGRIRNGKLLAAGKPSDFPFRDGSGVFQAQFDADDVVLSYHPDWPALTGLGGDALFEGERLTVNLRRGGSDNVAIREATVVIPSLSASDHLTVEGELAADIGDALRFMQKTPLKGRVKPVSDALTTAGATAIGLNLAIPLENDESARVDVEVGLQNAALIVNSLNLPVTGLRGTLKIDNKGVSSPLIIGKTLGQPVRIRIKDAPAETLIQAGGSVGLEALRRQFGLPEAPFASGGSDYRLDLRLPAAAAPDPNAATLELYSSLAGITLNLPSPLDKTGPEKKPLAATLTMAGEKAVWPLAVSYQNGLQADLRLNRADRKITSGRIVVGAGSLREPSLREQSTAETGISLDLRAPRLNFAEWLPWASAGQASDRLGELRSLSIRSANALWRDQALGAVDLTLAKRSRQWSGVIKTDFARGRIGLPNAGQQDGTFFLKFDTLDLSGLQHLHAVADETRLFRPNSLPPLNLVSLNTLWRSAPLGKLSLITEPSAQGLKIKRLALQRNGIDWQSDGNWTAVGDQSSTQLRGRIKMPKAGQLLNQLDITHELAETRADIGFNLHWPDPPYRFAWSDLQGRVEAVLKNGRLLSIEPGFGRLLGALAMAQWVNRLKLDFRDVFAEGLTFNSIDGHFAIVDGKARTEDLTVDAVPARITLKGTADLAARTVDHIVKVAPKSADAVPIAGTIMGKVAALVARSLTGEDQEGFLFGSEYRIVGGFSDPRVIPLHENDGLLHKTWNGLTAFPWFEAPPSD